MKEIKLKFRDNLLCLRQQRNMTQEQFAMLLGVSRQSVAKWEAGQSTPEVDKLVKMADLFGCTLDELVSGDLSARPVSPAEVMPEGAPAEDVCGYDAHMRRFAFGIATGVAFIVVGIAIALLADALLEERFAEAVSPATALGLLLLFGGMAASDAGNSGLATVCAYFWVVWPIGGIACGIATLAMKSAADK